MEENLIFKSSLAGILKLFLQNYKTTVSPTTYARKISHMHDFDEFLVKDGYKEGDPLNEPLLTRWLSTHKELKNGSINFYSNSLRVFLRFYSEYNGKPGYLPPLYKEDDLYMPYLISDDEMECIYNLVDNYNYGPNLASPFIQFEFPMVIRLLDSNGFRLNELLTTKMTEINLRDGVLKMVNTKNERQRLVPLTGSMTELLDTYCKAMGLYEGTEAYLFPKRTFSEPLINTDIANRFRKVLVKVGIRKGTEDFHARGACIHCLRHRFTLNSIKQLLQKGITMEDVVPYLSIYLGHTSISETEKYMKFFADMFPEELDKFGEEATKLLPDESIWNDWM